MILTFLIILNHVQSLQKEKIRIIVGRVNQQAWFFAWFATHHQKQLIDQNLAQPHSEMRDVLGYQVKSGEDQESRTQQYEHSLVWRLRRFQDWRIDGNLAIKLVEELNHPSPANKRPWHTHHLEYQL